MKGNRRNFIRKSTAMAAMSVVGLGSVTPGLLDQNDEIRQMKQLDD